MQSRTRSRDKMKSRVSEKTVLNYLVPWLFGPRFWNWKKKQANKCINSIYALIVFLYYNISSGREILFFKFWVIERLLTLSHLIILSYCIYIGYMSYWSKLAILSCTATLIITDCSGNWQHINISTKNPRFFVCFFFLKKIDKAYGL